MRTGTTSLGKTPATIPNATRTKSRSVPVKSRAKPSHGLGEVRRISGALELSNSVRDQACQLFRSAQNENLLRGRSIEAIAAASVYGGACRCNGLSRLVGEVSEMARVVESRVTNAYKTLNEELGLPCQARLSR